MKKAIIISLCLCALTMVHAQKKTNPSVYAKSITADDLKKHLYIVASKEMEGRETGTEGQRKAAAYIETQFRNLGLTPGNNGSYQMNFPVYQDTLTSSSIEVNGKTFMFGNDFDVDLRNNHNTTFYSNEIIFVGSGQSDSVRDDYAGLNAKGRIVLVVTDKSSPRVNENAVMDAAQKNGAAAVLYVTGNFPRSKAIVKGRQYLNLYKRNITPDFFYVSPALATAIIGKDFESTENGELKPQKYSAEVKLDFQKTMLTVQSSNVLGYIEGSDKKDEYVFITGHYDHLGKRDTVIFYGADDDGSGTVSVIELAEAFSKAKTAGKGPRRTIVFMTVSGEEKGLWGSEYYSNHPVFPLEKTSVDLNIDMVGRIDPARGKADSLNYVYVIGDDKVSSELRTVSETMNNKYVKMGLDYKFNDPKDPNRFYYRSDHYNFAKKGVPIIFYFNGTHKDYHQKTDTPDKINYNLMTKRVQLVFYTAWEMANRDEMMKRDIPLDTSIFTR